MADIETPKWRCKNKIGNLMTRLYKHGNGEVEMTTSQIQAAKAYLAKTVPDLQSMELSSDPDKPVFPSVVKLEHVEPSGKDTK